MDTSTTVIIISLLVITSILTMTSLFFYDQKSKSDKIIVQLGDIDTIKNINECVENNGIWLNTTKECTFRPSQTDLAGAEEFIKNSKKINECVENNGIWLNSTKDCTYKPLQSELSAINEYIRDDLRGGETAKKIRECVLNDNIWINYYKEDKNNPLNFNVKKNPAMGECLSNFTQLDLINMGSYINNSKTKIPNVYSVVS